MKSLKASLGAIFIAVAMTLAFTAGMSTFDKSTANAQASAGYNHFYKQAAKDSRAEKFYKAFESLEADGQIKSGKVELDLVEAGVVSGDDVANYVNNGDMKIPKAYGAGRDAYIMDHPDLFYADLFSTSVSAGQQSKNYVAFLDTSNALSLYRGNLNTAQKVETAVAAYEAKLTEIVNGAKAAGSGAKEQIEYVNKYIAEHTEYSYGTKIENGRNVDTDAADYISTAYGSLVNGKAICGGYATGFKAVMDRLGIPCVCVQGSSLSDGAESYQAHMWNYVEVDGLWYAVDVTWNDTSNNLTKWLLVGGETLFKTHIEDPVISSSGYELDYPSIKPYDYGNDTDDNGMEVVGSYFDSNDNTGKRLKLTVNYYNKSAAELEKEGKYLAFRYGDDNQKGGITWGYWFNAIAADTMFRGFLEFKETETEFTIFPHTEYVQFALIDYKPDTSGGAHYPNEPAYGENAGKEWFYYYDNAKLTDEHFVVSPTALYHNNGYGTFVPSPGMAGIYPSNGGDLKVDQTYQITVTYNDDLQLVEGKTENDVEMEFYTSRGNDTVKQNATLTDVKWDGGKKISFTFTPSRMYIHNLAMYYFYPTCLVGKASNKVPDPFTYRFKGKSVVCSKVFNDGRLYMNVFGEPKMLDTSDLSVTDFKDENGNYYAKSQRSQLMLVASKPDDKREAEMDEVLKRDTAVKDEDVLSTSTYEIHLQICGVVRTVPNGSYMQVAFGFPEGYSPDDAGTTFKIYHYKHDNKGNITGVEEIPVIITEYGLIAKVQSFSPFTVVQLKKTSAAVTAGNKNVYATVTGNGGKVTTGGKGGIATLSGDSITYDITPDAGYQIANVKLNGKSLDGSKVKNGKLTLKKGELDESNMLEVSFVTEASVKSYADRGITISGINPSLSGNGGAPVGLIVGLVIGAVVLVGAGVAVFFLLKKRNAFALASASDAPAKSTEPKKSTKSKTATSKSASTKSTAKTATSKSTVTKSTGTSTAKPSAAKSSASAKTSRTSTSGAKPKSSGTKTTKK